MGNGVEERGRGFAYHGMAGNLGIAGGPLSTAVLLLAFGWRVVAAAIAPLFVPAASASLPGLLAVSFVLGFALFGVQPLTQATIAKYSLPESRGLSFGYRTSARSGSVPSERRSSGRCSPSRPCR